MEREGKKVLASCKIGCNVDLKYTCVKTGTGGGWGHHPEVFSFFYFREVSVYRTSPFLLGCHILQGHPSFLPLFTLPPFFQTSRCSTAAPPGPQAKMWHASSFKSESSVPGEGWWGLSQELLHPQPSSEYFYPLWEALENCLAPDSTL